MTIKHDDTIPLHLAISKGRLHMVKKILEASPESVTEVNSKGKTCLHIAVRWNYSKAVDYFLKWFGENISFSNVINSRDFKGFTALHCATGIQPSKPLGTLLDKAYWKDNLTIVKKLVESDKSLCVQKDKYGHTPFLVAVRRGRVDTLKLLLEACPEALKDVNSGGKTCLHIAVLNENCEALEYLINWLGESSSFSNTISNTAFIEQIVLQHATTKGSSLIRNLKSVDSVEIEDSCSSNTEHDSASDKFENRLDYEAFLNEFNQKIRMTSLQRYKKLFLVKDIYGHTPLHVAAGLGRLDIIEMLLKACPESVKEVNTTGSTCLHIAVVYNKSVAVEYLLKWFAKNTSFSNVINSRDHKDYTALHMAAAAQPTLTFVHNEDFWNEKLRIISKLVQFDKNLCLQKDKDGHTPLHIAAWRGRVDTLQILLEACPESLKEVSLTKKTCLEIAVLHKNNEAIEYLTKWFNGTLGFFNIIDNIACNEQRVSQQDTTTGSSLTMMMKSVDLADSCSLGSKHDHAIPLHLAISKGRLDLVENLLEASPESVMQVDSTGKTCLHVAVIYNYKKAVNYFLKWFWKNISFSNVINSRDCNDRTALHIAVGIGSSMPLACSMQSEVFWNDNRTIINKLVQSDKNLCLQKDKNGHTPFHVAVMRGRVDTLKIILEAWPEAVKDVIYGGNTCLHMAVLCEKIEALEYLINWLGESSSSSNMINNTEVNEQTVSQQATTEGLSLISNMKSNDSAEFEDSCSSSIEHGETMLVASSKIDFALRLLGTSLT